MNFTTKALAAAIALVASAGANAAYVQSATGTGSSVLLLAWDDTAQVGYVRELGVTWSNFFNQTTGLLTNFATTATSFAGDALYASTFAGSTASNIRWGVTAIDQTGATNNSTGIFVSRPAASPGSLVVGGINTYGPAQNLLVGNLLNSASSYAVTGLANPNNPGGGAANILGVSNSILPGSFGTFGDILNSELRVRSSTSATRLVEGTLSFELLADGTLCYGVTAAGTACGPDISAPVPVPAAVWLLGSALAGVAGVARRRA